MADGLVVHSDLGVVIQDLDRDGYEQTGWVLMYVHLADRDRVLTVRRERAVRPRRVDRPPPDVELLRDRRSARDRPGGGGHPYRSASIRFSVNHRDARPRSGRPASSPAKAPKPKPGEQCSTRPWRRSSWRPWPTSRPSSD